MTKVCVIGLGYIGLPTAVMLANAGVSVSGMDVERVKVDKINRAETDIKEANFQELLDTAISSGNLSASDRIVPSDAYLICVPTPFSKEDDSATLSYVQKAVDSMLPVLKKGDLIILESTVPPGTTNGILREMLESTGLKIGVDLHLAYCPERLLPGNLVHEILHNDRIIGGVTPESAEKAKDLYMTFSKGDIHITDATTAEFVKVAENTYGAVNLGLVNELAMMCDKLGINAREALTLASKHPRVNFMHPGPGVGGHCVPVDPWFLVKADADNSKVIKMSLETNENMPRYVVHLLSQAMTEAGKQVSGSKVVVMGVAYKKNVNDSRESPAISVIKILKEAGASVVACDPVVDEFFVPIEEDVMMAVEGADALVLITDHDVFKDIDLDTIRGKMAERPVLIDTRNIFSKPEGFVFKQLGAGD